MLEKKIFSGRKGSKNSSQKSNGLFKGNSNLRSAPPYDTARPFDVISFNYNWYREFQNNFPALDTPQKVTYRGYCRVRPHHSPTKSARTLRSLIFGTFACLR